MDRLRAHMLLAATMLILVVGFLLILSPPFTEFRALIGLPEHLPGARYNPEVGAAEIVGSEFYMARIAFAYHAVFAALLYATLVVAAGPSGRNVMDLSFLAALFTVIGGLAYSYASPDPLFHGLFIAGLGLFFAAGVLLLLTYKGEGPLHLNIKASGILLLISGAIGGYLGSSFMRWREDFLGALISARFDPDLAEENLLWRALTSHEHAMIAIALALTFFLALATSGVKMGRATKAALYAALAGQMVMALASYMVWPLGKVAHLAITPAALILLLATTVLSFMLKGRQMRYALIKLSAVIWASVVIPGALVAISLRKPIFFSPAFRDPAWDWAELAYNIGHWHILLAAWGSTPLLRYLSWPRNLLEESRMARAGAWLAVLGFSSASLAANFYMLANPPMEYVPNPYSSPWLLWLEPSLGIMALGVAIGYLAFLRRSTK